QHDLNSFREMVASLPGPFGTITPVQRCADALVDGIVKRRRKIYIPASLAPFAMLRQVFANPLSDLLIARRARRMVPLAEAEVAALGRSFGEHSVETQRRRE
ncbi:MAG: short-chain dehydrogenase, partial [Gemmatimonadaceae bacterium]